MGHNFSTRIFNTEDTIPFTGEKRDKYLCYEHKCTEHKNVTSDGYFLLHSPLKIKVELSGRPLPNYLITAILLYDFIFGESWNG